MFYPQSNAYRDVIDLSGLWEFTIDPDRMGEPDQWYRTGLPHPVEIAVPASWNEQFPGGELLGRDIRNYMGAAWYQTRFFVPSAWTDRRVWLRVGAANYRARVWLNGIFLGAHEGGFLPFEFEISDRIEHGTSHLLTILVDVELSADTVPQGLPDLVDHYPPVTFDFFPYGGLHRPVKLYTTPRNSISDLTLTTTMLLTQQMRVIESKSYTVGELIWAFSDFKTAQHYSRVVLNRKGLFTREREPKMAARVVRHLWATGDTERQP